MFYPVDSLKIGGRFYLCWVADSWPMHFASFTHRQIWSQDIRKICDELAEVMTNESGRPTNRYSLRLSSQLMRGLVRLYQRKVTFLLNELCMINANVMKQANKKSNTHETQHHERRQLQTLEVLNPSTLHAILQEEPEHETRVEEMIQNSGNVVANIQDITLKESVIPEFQLPPNDGFGEENPQQALQLLCDRTIEMIMMERDATAAQHSGLDLPAFDVTDKSHDKSRLAPQEMQMERLSEHELTMFRRSDGGSLLPAADFEKDFPEIPDVPIPDLPVPEEKQQEEPVLEIPEVPIEKPRDTARESQPIELEELEENEPRAKRRKFRGRLIIDKKIKISGNVLRARIENPNVELRCESSSDDIICIKVPYDVYMRRPCCAGFKERPNVSFTLTRLFMRNLGVVNRPVTVERDSEENIMQRSLRFHTRTMLEKIEEESTAVQDPPQTIIELAQNIATINQDNLAPPEIDLSKDFANVSERNKEQDISEMLTQKLETVSQQVKRISEHEAVSSPKRQRSIGYVSFRESQQKQKMEAAAETSKVPEIRIWDDKENVPENKQTPVRDSTKGFKRSVTAMLKEAGLSDIPTITYTQAEEPAVAPLGKRSRGKGSEGSETPLGSLDRTKVSLGDSDKTTDSKRFMRENWGTEGTMLKIMALIKRGERGITVQKLVSNGPTMPGYKAIIAAQCFTSILKLKQHAFIKIKKCPDSLEIEDIMPGEKLL